VINHNHQVSPRTSATHRQEEVTARRSRILLTVMHSAPTMVHQCHTLSLTHRESNSLTLYHHTCLNRWPSCTTSFISDWLCSLRVKDTRHPPVPIVYLSHWYEGPAIVTHMHGGTGADRPNRNVAASPSHLCTCNVDCCLSCLNGVVVAFVAADCPI
jgi:hypothetical protein